MDFAQTDAEEITVNNDVFRTLKQLSNATTYTHVTRTYGETTGERITSIYGRSK